MRLVLFDLDGTLLDTAPDLGAALNAQRAEHNLAPLAFEDIRPQVSHGSPALLKLGFGVRPDDSRYAGMRTRLLEIYRARLSRETRFFPGIEPLLVQLEHRGLRWGVVTNKPIALTEPLLDAFRLRTRAVCVVGGDSTARRKPYPDGLLQACTLAHIAPAAAVYVGDARQDIVAAHSAGMRAALVLYGYLSAEDQPATWNADLVLQQPGELLDWLESETSSSASLQDARA